MANVFIINGCNIQKQAKRTEEAIVGFDRSCELCKKNWESCKGCPIASEFMEKLNKLSKNLEEVKSVLKARGLE